MWIISQNMCKFQKLFIIRNFDGNDVSKPSLQYLHSFIAFIYTFVTAHFIPTDSSWLGVNNFPDKALDSTPLWHELDHKIAISIIIIVADVAIVFIVLHW